MNPLKLICNAVIRYRRTRGFGVHSPFAYGFITQVLGCTYPYYCWPQLEAEVKSAGKMRWRDARAMFRTLNQMNPANVYVCPEDPYDAALIVEMWNGNCEITSVPSGSRFLVIGDESPCETEDIIAGGKTVFFTSVANPLWHKLLLEMERGQSFTNSVTGIVVCNPKLPLHHFEISY